MELLQKILDAGVVGAGGAGFPTHVKLDTKVDCLLINAIECEPLLYTDKYIMNNFATDVVDGVDLAANHLGATQVYIGIKRTNEKEISSIQKAIDERNSKAKIFPVDNYYPSGDEHMLVYEITGKTVPQGGIPLDVGIVVSNVGTMRDIFKASKDEAVTHKFLTVTGEVANPTVIFVPIGTSFEECIQACGGPTISNYKVISGGPMMASIYEKEEESNLFVTKTTSGIILIKEDKNFNATLKETHLGHVLNRAKAACIRCRLCTDLCPRHLIGHRLHPHRIMRSMAASNFKKEYVIENQEVLKEALICCECSICETYACPMELLPR